MKRVCLILGFALLSASPARTHNPYEITSVVYLRSNRVELIVEMEFPTGMTLAGVKASREVSAASQFEAARPQLENLAGAFLEITAGNRALVPLRTNVQLGVEAHIQSQVQFAPTDYRPLRFVPRGLRRIEDAPYGVSLTVLDMVKQQVLGQTTLFADSLPAEFPAMAPGAKASALAAPKLPSGMPNPPSVIAAETKKPARTAEGYHLPRTIPLLAIAFFTFVAVLLMFSRLMKTRG